MFKRMALLFTAVVALAAGSIPAVASAKHTLFDDQVVQVRHGADDPPGDDRGGKGADDATLARNGADDPPGDDRGGHGGDDGARHS
jgi:hypothetical protein